MAEADGEVPLSAEMAAEAAIQSHDADNVEDSSQPDLEDGDIDDGDDDVAELVNADEEGAEKLSQALQQIQINLEDVSSSAHPVRLSRPEDDFPVSYRENTAKETETIHFVENFQRQFQTLYPQRRPLKLIHKNECGVQKFVSTTIRPTLLPFHQLTEHTGVSAFVADFIAYKPLEEPTFEPKVLPSPATTLWNQEGNSLDIAIVLASLLEGAGYRCCCVMGYATRDICLGSRFRTELPMFKAKTEETKPAEQPKKNKYALRTGKVLESRYEREMEQRVLAKQKEQADKEAAEARAKRAAKLKPEKDELFGMRLHAWVLLLPGQRGVVEPFFIEPTSGRAVSTADPNYLGIEYVFNSRNLWVNMQSCVDGLADTEYILADTTKWEFLFPDANEVQSSADILGRDPKLVDVECAPSWVEPLTLEPEEFRTRCPQGKRQIETPSSRIELFADYLCQDGMVKRTTTFADFELSKPIDRNVTYKHREDRLISRRDIFEQDDVAASTMWTYLPGHTHKLVRHEHVLGDGLRRIMTFDASLRTDGLKLRFESLSEFYEKYENREDRLIGRHCMFAKHARDRLISSSDKSYDVIADVEIMMESYSADTSLPHDKDIEEIFFLPDVIQIKYRREPSALSSPTVELEKPVMQDKTLGLPAVSEDFVDQYHPNPKQEPLRKFEIFELMQQTLAMERTCRKALRSCIQESADILAKAEKDAQSIDLQVSFYDTVRNQHRREQRIEKEHRAQLEKEHEERQAEDPLAPFLIQLDDADNLDATKAAWVREACLKAFSERLTERAKLIEKWYDREKTLLQDKQAWFTQNQANLSELQEEEYVNYCSEANFRIQILVKRLEKHKQLASQRYLEMDQMIRQDPRLADFFQA